MDDVAMYGEAFHVLNFSNAVKLGLLVDYKVLVLAVEEAHVSRSLQKLLADEDNQLKVDDAAKIVGCWKALSKQGVRHLANDPTPMRRAVAFCQVINPGGSARGGHKVSSKQIATMFEKVVQAYQDTEDIAPEERFICSAQHVDGTMNASQKEEKLAWLKGDISFNTCRILSNVRCLSEGVDVPALDAVLFLTPRNSQVDVVQSVGRVMRIAPGKKRGYVILPVVIPVGVEPHEALNDNVTYKVVWQVLQALRSHDDRFDAMINKLELDFSPAMLEKMEVIAVVDKLMGKKTKKPNALPRGSFGIGAKERRQNYHERPEQLEIQFEIGEIERAIYAKVVQKCGNRHHWEEWADDIAKIARTHIDRINGILENPDFRKEQQVFAEFANELRDDLNDAISDDEIVEMLAQHLITKPVFDALFKDYSFAAHNPVSKAMQGMLDVLHEHHLEKEADTLEEFYESVRMRAEGIENATGKQKIVVELYDKFFRNAFPKMTERLGIVYTPVEVVDFIIHSVNHLLTQEFGQTLGSKGVHIIDPFTGTGTFITRLLQSGIISDEELAHKYQREIHANEIVLLAYYIAAINIEAVYHSIAGGEYLPFGGICLTDTFQLHEKEDLISRMFVDNSNRRNRQKNLDIRVVIGNPPYSVGQASANDNNQNVAYPDLDERIRKTYAERSKATNKNALYDSYIRAIRWASDRVGNSGIIGFVTNAGFTEANTADGLRQCLAEEFSSIYVFHLRGNCRTSGEMRRKEKDNIFGLGSRAPVAVSLLVKNPDAQEHGQIFFHDIGDYLTREQKLAKIVEFGSVAGIAAADGWTPITPDVHGDWLRQRDDSFSQFIVMGDKGGGASNTLFDNYSSGVKTQRDAWCYNSSKNSLATNMESMIEFYNLEIDRLNSATEYANYDPSKISWSDNLKKDLAKKKRHLFDNKSLNPSIYRPFTKQWLYYNRQFNERVYQMPRIFPDATAENLVICVAGVGSRDFSLLMASKIPCLDNIEKGQCFPLYLYDEPAPEAKPDLFNREGTKAGERERRDAITDEGLKYFQAAYPSEDITKEDIFYYVYGLLHSPDYRERYADNLSKELPRIPCVKKTADFWHFNKAGRALAKLHTEYENIEMYPATIAGIDLHRHTETQDHSLYRVEKMRYAKTKIDGKTRDDKTTLIYNDHITVSNIPPEAYTYIVNGKSALDWVVERQCVKTDKDSGITNDANLWATETMNNPRYHLELFLRVITVSIETMKIVNNLPKLDI
jgi:predicted helicase